MSDGELDPGAGGPRVSDEVERLPAWLIGVIVLGLAVLLIGIPVMVTVVSPPMGPLIQHLVGAIGLPIVSLQAGIRAWLYFAERRFILGTLLLILMLELALLAASSIGSLSAHLEAVRNPPR